MSNLKKYRYTSSEDHSYDIFVDEIYRTGTLSLVMIPNHLYESYYDQSNYTSELVKYLINNNGIRLDGAQDYVFKNDYDFFKLVPSVKLTDYRKDKNEIWLPGQEFVYVGEDLGLKEYLKNKKLVLANSESIYGETSIDSFMHLCSLASLTETTKEKQDLDFFGHRAVYSCDESTFPYNPYEHFGNTYDSLIWMGNEDLEVKTNSQVISAKIEKAVEADREYEVSNSSTDEDDKKVFGDLWT